MRAFLASILLLLALSPGMEAVAQVTYSGCSPDIRASADNWARPTLGPLRLRHVACAKGRSSSFTWTPSQVSPDGDAIAAYGHAVGLLTSSLTIDAPETVAPVDLGISGSWGPRDSGPGAFAWADDGRSLWTAIQDHLRPLGGWATSPLRPTRYALSGDRIDLPPLTHPSGPLDAIWWIDGRGHALAQFGTSGGYYRPSHEDPDPTLAFVDAASGVVLDTIALSALAGKAEISRDSSRSMIRGVSAVPLRDGRLRAFIGLGDWVVWTQGERPRFLPDPYLGQARAYELSPDGSKVLVSLRLPPRTLCPPIPPCQAGPLVRGPVAALHDLRDGRRLWRIKAEDDWGGGGANGAFSPDGRLALVALPRRGDVESVAVVSVRAGKVLQILRAPSGSGAAFGFLARGHVAWISLGGRVLFYDVK